MKRNSNRQQDIHKTFFKIPLKLKNLLQSKNAKYLLKLLLFILLYRIGGTVFAYLETNPVFSGAINSLYNILSSLITRISVIVYSLVYSEVHANSNFIIFINNTGVVRLLPGCTGLMQLFQILFILLFFPLPVKQKLFFMPVSVLIILFAAIFHYLILVPVAYRFPAYFDIFHTVFSRVVFYLFFFLNFVIWTESLTGKRKASNLKIDY